MKMMKITPFHFNQLVTQNLSLDHIYLLELASDDTGIDLKATFDAKEKLEALVQTCIRNGLLTEDQRITPKGKEVLEFMSSKPGKKMNIKRRIDLPIEDFDAFWLAYPATDTIIKDGQILYSGTRALRKGNKADCKVKLSKIIAEGKYTIDDIIKAVQYEVTIKTNASIKEKTNKLKYMTNIETYLNQKGFEAFIDLAKLNSPSNTPNSSFIIDI